MQSWFTVLFWCNLIGVNFSLILLQSLQYLVVVLKSHWSSVIYNFEVCFGKPHLNNNYLIVFSSSSISGNFHICFTTYIKFSQIPFTCNIHSIGIIQQQVKPFLPKLVIIYLPYKGYFSRIDSHLPMLFETAHMYLVR